MLVLCKEPDGINVFDFPGGDSHAFSVLQVLFKRSHKEDLNKSSWLYSNKTLLMDVVRFMKFISYYSQSDILLIFLFLLNHVKNRKTIPSFPALQKQAW